MAVELAATSVLANLLLRPLVRLIRCRAQPARSTTLSPFAAAASRKRTSARYCSKGSAAAALGLGKLDSINLENGDSVEVTATFHSANRNDAALEQIVTQPRESGHRRALARQHHQRMMGDDFAPLPTSRQG